MRVEATPACHVPDVDQQVPALTREGKGKIRVGTA
jgi:hypothetical protein